MDERADRVLDLLHQMIGIDSLTATNKEQQMETWLRQQLQAMGETVQAGVLPLEADPAGRSVVYGFLRGTGTKTIIFMNHHDVVGNEAYGNLADLAFSPEPLCQALMDAETDEVVLDDLRSGEWLVGRGSCDMKGGMAAQLAVFEEYADQVQTEVNLLFLSVPDEESFSAGMRAALPFLRNLKEKEALTYELLVDCEPNQQEEGRLTAYTGSVGKLLPVILVQGKATHISDYRHGLNPLGILSRIVAATEGNPSLADYCDDEQTPPPVWMHLRDNKDQYDFSLPYRATAYASFLSYDKTPADILRILKETAAEAVAVALGQVQGTDKVPVVTFEEIVAQAKAVPGFSDFYLATLHASEKTILSGQSNYPEQTLVLIEQVLDYAGMTEPMVVLAFAPPYYPAADSRRMGRDGFPRLLRDLSQTFPVRFNHYFNGVSDCSYCGIDAAFDTHMMEINTPLWGNTYSFDLQLLQALQIPFLLLGPWGKDLHSRAERVHIPGVTSLLPEELRYIVEWFRLQGM